MVARKATMAMGSSKRTICGLPSVSTSLSPLPECPFAARSNRRPSPYVDGGFPAASASKIEKDASRNSRMLFRNAEAGILEIAVA
jgi:hypothetical protein